MLAVVRIPALDSSSSKATLLRYTVKAGDTVARGAQIAEIETEKASFPVETPHAGKVAELACAAPSEIDVGAIVLTLETDDAGAEAAGSAPKPPKAKRSANGKEARSALPAGSGANGAYHCSEAARVLFNEAADLPVPVVPRLHVSPAQSESVPVAQFAARDVALAERRILAGSARRTQERMLWSARNIATSSVSLPFEIGPLQARVEAQRTATRQLLNPTDVLIWATAQALRQFPELNAYRHDNELCIYQRINVGVVYDIKGELIVPAVLNADGQSVTGLAGQLRELYKQLAAQKLPSESLGTATFTVSNLFGSGVTQAHPLVNAGQSGILLIGAPYRQAVAEKEGVRFGQFINLVLGFDHAVVNGVRAGAFLKRVAQLAQEATF